MKTKKMKYFLPLGILCLFLSACGRQTISGVTNENPVLLNEPKESDLFFDYTEGTYITIHFDGEKAESAEKSVLISNGSVTVTKSGVYLLEGSFEGSINIETEKGSTVWLVLNDVSIEAKDGPAVYAKNKGQVVLMLPEGTVNSLKDSKSYSNNSDDGPNGAVFCDGNLTINGTGTLQVEGKYNDGIAAKGALTIVSGSIFAEADDDGIRGRDSLTIYDGNISVKASGHALKTTNDEDDESGCLLVCGGKLVLDAGTDGINSANSVRIGNSDIEINAGDDGIHADRSLTVESGKIDVKKSVEGLEAVLITINGGYISVASSDDGINANGGSDPFRFDGFGGFGGFAGRTFDDGKENSDKKGSETDESPCITINGGEIYVDAKGDGLDSNGDIVMNGGFVFVSGPSDNGNNATDYQDTFTMDGGMIVACGSSGMYQSISNGSKCYAIDYLADSYIQAGTNAALLDGEKEIVSFSVTKRANAILIAGEGLENGKEYTLKIGEESFSVKASEESSGGMGAFGNFGGPGGFNGGPGGKWNPGTEPPERKQ